MRVLVISNLYPSKATPYYGSFVKNFEDQLRSDTRVGHLKGIYIKGLHGSSFRKVLSYSVFYIKIIYNTLFKNFDLIYVHLISHSTLPLRLVSFFKKLPLIFNIHGEDLLTTTPLAGKLLKLALPLVKQAQFIVVPSYFFKNTTEQYISDYPSERIIVSASGGIKDIFFRANNCKNEHSLSRGIKIGFVSRIDRGKGWDTLIEAADKLEKEGVDYYVNIAGGGPQTEDLKSKIKELGLTRVKYVGPIPHEELPSFYQSLDLFVFPTKLRESLGLVGLEAMACGVPVIGSRIGGLTDYIKENGNGFFFTPGKADELAHQIKRFAETPEEKRNEMRCNAQITAEEYRDTSVATKLFNTIL